MCYIFEAGRVLAGNQLYGPHLSETNPPIIVWFSAISVLLARHLAFSAVIWFRTLVLLILCVTAGWCVRLLERSGRVTSGLGLAFFGLSILCAGFSTGAYEFGQREHLLVMLLLPYVIGVGSGAVQRISPVERAALGLAAGCAIWFKPHDLLVVVGLELTYVLCAKTLRHILSIEFVAMAATACFLLVLVVLLTPLYIHQVLPLLSDVYWGLGTDTFSSLLLGCHVCIAAFVLGFLGYFLLRGRLLDKTTPAALLACSFGAYVAYALQHTTWTYHKYPHRAFYLLAVFYMLTDLLHPFFGRIAPTRLLAGRPRFVLSGCALLLVLVLILRPEIVRDPRMEQDVSPVTVFMEQVKPGTTVSSLSTSVPILASAFDHGLNWGSRFAHLWMLPAILQNEMGRTSASSPFKQLSAEKTEALAALQRREVAEDLVYWHPDFVLVPVCTREEPCQGIEGKDVNLVAWFKRSPEFSEVWSRYEQQAGFAGYEVYRLAK